MTSFNVMLLSDDVTYQFVLNSVVSKHLLLALSVLCLYCGINRGGGGGGGGGNGRIKVHDIS